jgi:hypothetical protein
MAKPLKKLTIKKINEPELVTAPMALSLMKKPTHHASKVLYSCWNTCPRKMGRAKSKIAFPMGPSVKER